MISNAIRNRVTEKDVRAWMDDNGFYGNSADIEHLELYAVQRPGWLQIFSFQTRVKLREESEQPWRKMYGAVKDDERRSGNHKTQVELFANVDQQTEKLQQWSEGLIARGNQSSKSLLLLTAGVFLFAVVALSVINLFS